MVPVASNQPFAPISLQAAGLGNRLAGRQLIQYAPAAAVGIHISISAPFVPDGSPSAYRYVGHHLSFVIGGRGRRPVLSQGLRSAYSLSPQGHFHRRACADGRTNGRA